jgi:hypothetical protein
MVKNNNTLTIGAVMLLVVGIIFGISGSSGNAGAVNIWENSAKLEDNSLTKDKNIEGYENNDGKLSDLVNQTNTVYNVTKDENGDLVYFDLRTNETQTITENNQKSVIELSENQEIKKAWINENFNLDGFNKYFEAFLIYDNAWDKYTLVYRIDNEKFIINNLKKQKAGFIPNNLIVTPDNIPSWPNNAQNYGTFLSKLGLTTENDVFVNVYGDTVNNYLSNVVSYIGIDNDGNLKIAMGFYNNYNVYNLIVYHYDSSNGLNANMPTNDNYLYGIFAIDELQSYSYDSIALYKNTKTLGFDKVTLVKQELNNGDASFTDKYFKIVSGNDFKQIVETNDNLLSDFMKNRINENLQKVGLDNDLLANEENYLLGVDINGVIIDNGYVSQTGLRDGNVVAVTQVKFNPDNSNGLQFSDLGASYLQASQIEALTFGNLKDNFNIIAYGTAYFVEPSLWDQALGVVWNVLTFDFDGVSQFWTNSVKNPFLSDNRELGSVNGDVFAFTSAVKNPNNDRLDFTTQKPVTTLLEYDGANYWLFYTLETQDGSEGCMVIDYLNTNLNKRIPATICSDVVAGTNSASQFKINSN